MLDNLTVILSLMVVKSLKPVLILFTNCIVFLYLYRSPVLVPFFHIRVDSLYRYYFPVLCYTIVISTMLITWHVITRYWLWHIITWHLLVITWHLFDITYHLPYDILPLDLRLTYFENLVLLSCIIYSDMIPNTHVLLYSWIFEPDLLLLFP